MITVLGELVSQKTSMLNELDIVPILKGFKLLETDDGLVVENPPTVRVTNNSIVTEQDLKNMVK